MSKGASLLLAVLALIMLTGQTFSWPIPYQPLRKLATESDLIVVSKVISDDVSEGKAILRLDSIIKGQAVSSVIAVYYPAGLICPEPPKFPPGQTVLAFLKHRESTDGYETVGLSYGAKLLPDLELDVHVRRVRELLEILNILDEEPRRLRIAEWLISCAEDPVTRWDAANELSDQVSEWGPYEDKDRTDELYFNYASLLTQEQKERLLKALLISPLIEGRDMELIRLMELWGEKRACPFILAWLKNFDDAPESPTIQLMHILARMVGSERGSKLASEYGNLGWETEESGSLDSQRKEVLEKYIKVIEREGDLRSQRKLIEDYRRVFAENIAKVPVVRPSKEKQATIHTEVPSKSRTAFLSALALFVVAVAFVVSLKQKLFTAVFKCARL